MNGKFINLLEKKIPSVLVPQDDKQVIHIKDLADGFDQIVINMKKTLENKGLNYHTVNDVFDIIVKTIIEINRTFNLENDLTITNNQEQSIKIKIMDILNSLDVGNQDFIKKLNEYIQENISDKILTYVKINNFNHDYQGGQSKWNKRFDILLNHINPVNPINDVYNSMIVKYNDINEAYNYDRPDAKYYEKDKYKYTKQYLFGNFSQIFPPNMKNPDIATQMTQIVAKVKSGKPVFVMGYGASGSGKTSSLIYFKDGEEGKKEGIVIDICKQICEGSFNTIELSTQELFSKNTEQTNENDETIEIQKTKNYDKCDKNDSYINCNSEKYIFTYTPNNDHSNKHGIFIIKDGNNNPLPIHHSYRINNENNIIDDKNVFAKTIEYLIDKDRLVKATTNNPQSSRSHSFAFFKFYNEPLVDGATVLNGYLIVGDFAGVENTFNCNSVLTIKDLLNIEDNKDKNKLYYGGYKTDKYKEIAGDIIYNYVEYCKKKKKDNSESAIIKKLNNTSPNIINLKTDLNQIRSEINSKQPIVLTEILEGNENEINAFAKSLPDSTLKSNIQMIYGNESNIANYAATFNEFKKNNKITDVISKYSTSDVDFDFSNYANSIESYKLKQRLTEEIATMKSTLKKQQETAELKRKADEAELKRKADEAELKRISDEAEKKRIQDEEKIKALQAKRQIIVAEKLKAQEEANRKAQEDANRKAQEDANRKAQEDANRKAQEEAKRKADEAKRKVDEQKRLADEAARESKENNTYKEFQNKKIDEKYFSNFIDNIIYPKYAKTFYEMVKLTVKKGPNSNMPFVYDKQDTSYSEENLKTDFNTWISNILKILKIDFIDKNLEMIMPNFTKYTFNDLYKKINTIKPEIDKIKSTNIELQEKNIINKYKTFNEINLNIQPIEGRTNDSISKIHFAIKEINKSNVSEYYLEEDVINMFTEFKTTNTNIDKIKNEILTKLKEMVKTQDRKVELEDIENYKFFIDLFSNKSKGFKETKPFTDNIKKIKAAQDNIVDELKKVFSIIQERLQKGQLVCDSRTNEGEFINKSLQDMREDIKNIFYEKQEDVLYISPD